MDSFNKEMARIQKRHFIKLLIETFIVVALIACCAVLILT